MAKLPGKIKTKITITQIGNFRRPHWWNFPAMRQWKLMEKEIHQNFKVALTPRKRSK